MMSDRIFIKAEKLEYGLILTLINLDGAESCGVRAMQETSEYYPDDGSDGGTDTFGTDEVMYEFFEGFIANTEYEWIGAEEIGALTDAPILGIKDEDGNVLEAYGFMNYAVRSLMEDLRDGKVILRKG
jgi:hypothetical protein